VLLLSAAQKGVLLHPAALPGQEKVSFGELWTDFFENYCGKASGGNSYLKLKMRWS